MSQPITITGFDGEVTVDRDGNILSRRPTEEDPVHAAKQTCYADVKRFDMAEYRLWWECKLGFGPDHNLDFTQVGYWDTKGKYVPADADMREETEQAIAMDRPYSVKRQSRKFIIVDYEGEKYEPAESFEELSAAQELCNTLNSFKVGTEPKLWNVDVTVCRDIVKDLPYITKLRTSRIPFAQACFKFAYKQLKDKGLKVGSSFSDGHVLITGNNYSVTLDCEIVETDEDSARRVVEGKLAGTKFGLGDFVKADVE